MKIFNRVPLLLAIIVIEGYAVLAAEVLAMRLVVPFVGSGTDTVSIIVAAVLLPLALGYYVGGLCGTDARRKLTRNILVALLFLTAGLSYAVLDIFFDALMAAGIKHRLGLTAIYALVFLALPVFLLGQTVPLAGSLFPQQKIGRLAGRILFFSTLGSFAGALFTTLVLMTYAGVHVAAAFTLCLLALAVVLLARKKFSFPVMMAGAIAVVAVGLNSNLALEKFGMVANNAHNTAVVRVESDGARLLMLNNMRSSLYGDDGRKHAYVEFLERRLLEGAGQHIRPREILVAGAGAFTFGFDDTFHRYDYVDIDGALQSIAEKHVLRQKLRRNKKFIAMDARAYLAGTEKLYDVILLDLYSGGFAMPEHLVTAEFFALVKKRLAPDGLVVLNIITVPDFSDDLSRGMDDTFRSVFPYTTREIVQLYNPWRAPADLVNALYIARKMEDAGAKRVYTDDKNTVHLDKP